MGIFVTPDHHFELTTDHTSYLFNVLESGDLGHVYYGPKLAWPNYANLEANEFRMVMPVLRPDTPEFSLDNLKQEYPSYGHGDFRYPAYQITYPDGSRISEFQYDHYAIVRGKTALPHFPSAFSDGDQDDVETLTVYLEDKTAKLSLALNYSVFPHQDVIVRSAAFTNTGTGSVTLDAAGSFAVDLPSSCFDLYQLSGAWARERHLYHRPLTRGIQSVSSTRNSSSAQQNPFIALGSKQIDDANGAVYGFSLIYSGSFLAQAEVDYYDTTRVTMGINPFDFVWQLAPEESFQTPEGILTYSDQGWNGMSDNFHQFLTHHLLPQRWVNQDRPILINNWEATYFNFNEEKLVALGEKAKALGIELLVLDDGWFGKRNDATTSLGDWEANLAKLPNGLAGLSKKIHGLGLKFGLWFEPEMVSQESNLYKAHPDWVIHVPNRRMTPSRNQFVLDFSRTEVIDYLYRAMSQAIQEAQLDYIKWDMNRHITELYSLALPPEREKELGYRYIQGVYQLYERLTTAFPDVLFESCASGGGRFDPGLLYYAPQAWTSDDTDAMERLKIQWGTSLVYPLSTMGAHVSAVPNHQTRRITSLKTRAEVAYFGLLGYELDITKLSLADETTIKDQIRFYKTHRTLLQHGKFIRLVSPYANDGNVTAWMVISPDGTEAIAARYQVLAEPNPDYHWLKFTGLDPQAVYTINGQGQYGGDELMSAGLFIPQLFDIRKARDPSFDQKHSFDFSSALFLIKRVAPR
ncbi:alpha-galactosidase [Schleiferilactobacillus harbinensis]|uniref:alpha-galactosidase n=1 Tax=Schleiferilactobacillus harbinensis TaxID=304207 RepID=UPI0011752A55|nr:alpha-galactosidase [Schleiferilactobacillus harbinensis]GEK04769.1 alpha-galactosidase [Schleiferilactobacillus harbinensis]